MNALVCGYIPPSELRRTSRLTGIRELLGILVTNYLPPWDVMQTSARTHLNVKPSKQLYTN